MQTESIPSGCCQCGCGEQTPLATSTRPSRGYVKGEPLRFMPGHGKRKPLIDRVIAKMQVHPLGCWEYTGATSNGYGRVQSDQGAAGTIGTHRVMYEEFFGEIPSETLDHLCLNTRCMNPAHLEPVTKAENTRRQVAGGRGGDPGSVNREKTHCVHGHELSGDNVRILTGSRPGRACRACEREHSRRYRAKRA